MQAPALALTLLPLVLSLTLRLVVVLVPPRVLGDELSTPARLAADATAQTGALCALCGPRLSLVLGLALEMMLVLRSRTAGAGTGGGGTVTETTNEDVGEDAVARPLAVGA